LIYLSHLLDRVFLLMDLQANDSVTIKFAENVQQNEYKVFEMPESLLNELLTSAPGTVRIRGLPDSEAVLVSSNKTYTLRMAESTNTILLLPPAISLHSSPSKKQKTDDSTISSSDLPSINSSERQVAGFITFHYELTEAVPRVHMLRELLSKHLYSGTEDEPAREQFYSFARLQGLVQASDGEIKAGLEALGAVNINGFWRVLEPNYAVEVFQAVIDVAAANRWSLTSLPIAAAIQAVSEPAEVVRHCIRQHSRPEQASSRDAQMGNVDSASLDETKVCLFYAKQLFQQKDRFEEEELLKAWIELVPMGMQPVLSMLAGLALSRTSFAGGSGRRTREWHLLPVSRFSPDPAVRFQELFAVQPQWTLEEISPYSRPLTAPGQTHEQLLLRYCRVIRNTRVDAKEGSNLYTRK
jgi:sister chromatid cohesion protein DCC1